MIRKENMQHVIRNENRHCELRREHQVAAGHSSLGKKAAARLGRLAKDLLTFASEDKKAVDAEAAWKP